MRTQYRLRHRSHPVLKPKRRNSDLEKKKAFDRGYLLRVRLEKESQEGKAEGRLWVRRYLMKL
jgi:hypothetical protein